MRYCCGGCRRRALDLSLRFPPSPPASRRRRSLSSAATRRSPARSCGSRSPTIAPSSPAFAARAKTGLAEALATEHFAKVGVHRSLAPALAEGRALSWRHQRMLKRAPKLVLLFAEAAATADGHEDPETLRVLAEARLANDRHSGRDRGTGRRALTKCVDNPRKRKWIEVWLAPFARRGRPLSKPARRRRPPCRSDSPGGAPAPGACYPPAACRPKHTPTIPRAAAAAALAHLRPIAGIRRRLPIGRAARRAADLRPELGSGSASVRGPSNT